MKKIALILCLTSLQIQTASDSSIRARMARFFKFGSSTLTAQALLLNPTHKKNILEVAATARRGILNQLETMANLMGSEVKLTKIRHRNRIDWVSFTPKKITPVARECDIYKIHLMPKNYSLDFIYDVVAQLLNNDILKENVRDAKFQLFHLGEKNITKESMAAEDADRAVAPFVVLYTVSKERAQKVLNEVYTLFNAIEGSGVRPRFNSKVTDLIWLAQGNSNYKFAPDEPCYRQPPVVVTYEEPYRIYCASEESPNPHYLYHPETGQALTSIGE